MRSVLLDRVHAGGTARSVQGEVEKRGPVVRAGQGVVCLCGIEDEATLEREQLV